MAGLTLTLEDGDAAVVLVGSQEIEVTCVRAEDGRVSIAIVAPREFPIERRSWIDKHLEGDEEGAWTR